jgi:hypothetical protein
MNNELIKNTKQFVAYFDVLGYGNRIYGKSINEEYEIQKHLIDRKEERVKSNKQDIKYYSVHFSDVIILYGDNFSKIAKESLVLMYETAVKNHPSFLLRGAIGYGDFLVDDKRRIYIGSGLRDAYKFERKQEWMGCCLSDACYEKVRYDKPFEKYSQMGILVKYAVPLKGGVKEERYVINMEHCNRKFSNSINITPELIDKIFKGDKFNEMNEDTKKDINTKLKNTKDFFEYIEKVKHTFS